MLIMLSTQKIVQNQVRHIHASFKDENQLLPNES